MTLLFWSTAWRFTLSLGVVFLLAVAGLSAQRLRAPTPSPSAPPTLAQRLHSCSSQGPEQERFACFRAALHPELDARSPRAVLADLDSFQTSQQNFGAFCHEMAHVLGRYWIAKGRSVADGFREGSNVCHSGFFHGMVERVIRGEAADGSTTVAHLSPQELQAKVPAVCTVENLETTSQNFRFQCLHGLGHAAVFSVGYRLPLALSVCDALDDDWSRHSCYGGAFMENLTGSEPERRMVRRDDPHYPCNALDARYRDDCYGMQTSWLREQGMSWDAIRTVCRAAGKERLACFQSLGRDVSTVVRTEGPASHAPVCEKLPADERTRCIQGVVYALADHTWDGRYANAFCAVLSTDALRALCFTETHRHLLVSLEQPRDKVTADCRLLNNEQDACLRALQEIPS